MTETWSETCANCDCLLGDKVFTDEKEFDEHPDRELGYTNCRTHDEWLCPDCRDDDAIFCDECGDKVPAGDFEDGVCPWCVVGGYAFCDECDSDKKFLQKDLVDGYCPDCDRQRDKSCPELYEAIEKAEEAFKEIGVSFHRDYSCCNTCAHAELEMEVENNYVFYHEQESESIRQGHRSIHLGFSFTLEMRPKVLEMIAKNADILQWAGNDHTKIFLTCDAKEMEKQIEEDAERQERMRVKA